MRIFGPFVFFFLTGCLPQADAPVTVAPTLACYVAVRCTGYRWQAGIAKNTFLWVEGNHLLCHCEPS